MFPWPRRRIRDGESHSASFIFILIYIYIKINIKLAECDSPSLILLRGHGNIYICNKIIMLCHFKVSNTEMDQLSVC